MHSCDANGLHRSSSTLLERNAPGRCVKCVYASARPFRHYTIRRCNCQLAVPGANFLNVRPFARAPASPSVFFFFSKRRSGLTPFGEWSRGTRSVNMIKGGWSFFFLLSVVTTAGRVTRYRLLLCTRVGLMLILRLIHSYLNAIRFARINTNFVITYERKGTAEGVLKSRMRVFQNQRQKSRVYIL